MDELKKKAEAIADNQDIRILREKLGSYNPQLNNIDWNEKEPLGNLRTALRRHINTTIGRSSDDLQIFINHFGCR